MDKTAINSTDFLITSDVDDSVGELSSLENRNLEYLPTNHGQEQNRLYSILAHATNIGEKFPNLLKLIAGYCSIKQVSRDNFKGLSKLQELHLYENQIEKIDDNTFEFIPAVETIWLRLGE